VKPYGRCLVAGEFEGTAPCTDPHDKLGIHEAINYRISPVTPKVQNTKYKELKYFVKTHLEHLNKSDPQKSFTKLIHKLKKIDDVRQFTIDWLNGCKHYPIKYKEHLLKCFDQVYYDGKYHLEEWMYNCKSFIKREFYELPKRARLINSRTDFFKVCVGPYIHAIELEIYKLPQFVKGIPIVNLPTKLNTLNQFDYILETDYSSFESCFVPQYTEMVELQLFEFMLCRNPEIMHVIHNCYYHGDEPRTNNLICRKYYHKKVVGSRMSGEMWTSLANGFSNYINLKFLLKDFKETQYKFFIEGDDGILGMNQKFLTPQMFSELGFNIKMEYGSDLSHTSFCGNVFVPGINKLIMNPENITRLFLTCTPNFIHMNRRGAIKLLRSKAMNLWVSGQYTPIIQNLAFNVLRVLGKGTTLTYGNAYWMLQKQKIFDWNKLILTNLPIEHRELYESKYNITIEQQLCAEKKMNQWKTIDDIGLPIVVSQWNDPTFNY
jgi:hypothetical protein